MPRSLSDLKKRTQKILPTIAPPIFLCSSCDTLMILCRLYLAICSTVCSMLYLLGVVFLRTFLEDSEPWLLELMKKVSLPQILECSS